MEPADDDTTYPAPIGLKAVSFRTRSFLLPLSVSHRSYVDHQPFEAGRPNASSQPPTAQNWTRSPGPTDPEMEQWGFISPRPSVANPSFHRGAKYGEHRSSSRTKMAGPFHPRRRERQPVLRRACISASLPFDASPEASAGRTNSICRASCTVAPDSDRSDRRASRRSRWATAGTALVDCRRQGESPAETPPAGEAGRGRGRVVRCALARL